MEQEDVTFHLLVGRLPLRDVVLDTAPSTGGLQENTLVAADVLVIPCAVDHLSAADVRSTRASTC